MRTTIIIVLLFAGGFLVLASSYYLISGNLMRKNGVKVTGVIKEMVVNPQAEGVTNVLYRISCVYNDSIYIMDFSAGESNYQIGDSISYFFNPKNGDGIIYPLDNHFRWGNYSGLIIGIILIVIGVIIKRF